MRSRLLIMAVAWGVGTMVVVVSCAAAVGWWQVAVAARERSAQSFEVARAAGSYVRDQQIRRLKLISTAVANDAAFAGSLWQAQDSRAAEPAAQGVSAIRDLLEQGRASAGLAAAAILDADGKLVVAVGEGFLAEHDLSSLSVTARSKAESVQSAAMLDDDLNAALVAVTPMLDQGRLRALLVTALRLEAGSLKTIAGLAGADMALVVVEPNGPVVVDSSLDPAAAEKLAAMIESNRTRWLEAMPSELEIESGGRHWFGQAWPVQATARKSYFLALAPSAQRATIGRWLFPPVVIITCIALMLATVLLMLLWRGVLAPLSEMLNLSERARRGDFALELKPGGFAPVRRLGELLNYLLRELDRHRVPHGVPRRRSTDAR